MKDDKKKLPPGTLFNRMQQKRKRAQVMGKANALPQKEKVAIMGLV